MANSSITVYTSGAGVSSVNSQQGVVSLTQDNVPTGSTNAAYSLIEQSKLAGIAVNATQNQADSYLLSRANHTGTQTSSTISDFSTAADARITAKRGAASGIAPLDSNSLIPTSYIPGYQNSVVTVSTYSALPNPGTVNVIYVTLDTNKQYIWTGSVYGLLTASPTSTDQVPEGTTNLYFLTSRVIASVITGLSVATSAAIAATDTILQALGKLQAQITTRATTASQISIAFPINTTIPVCSSALYPFTINSITNLFVAAGSLTLSIQINGVNVTGLSNISVTTIPQTITASAANSATIGDRITYVISAVNNATGLEGIVKIIRAAGY